MRNIVALIRSWFTFCKSSANLFHKPPMETNAKRGTRPGRIPGALLVLTSFTFLALAFLPHENRTAAYESVAASSLGMLFQANVAYAEDHPRQGYASKLSDLSERSKGPDNGTNPRWMIDPILAGGEKHGYKFTYSPQSTKGDGIVDAYQIFADPVPGKPYRHHFFVDETGVFRMSDTGPANATSTVLEWKALTLSNNVSARN